MAFSETTYERSRNGYLISTDTSMLDLDLTHHYLSEISYWAKGRSREIVERSMQNSLNFGMYDREGKQVGFARVVTDYATFAYLADVFILEKHRGRGLSKWLMETILAHPGLQGLRRWMLATWDAHGLYEKYGFTTLARPERFMERRNPPV